MAELGNYQLISEREPIPGTPASGIYQAVNAALSVFDANLKYIPNLQARAVQRGSQTKANNSSGLKEATLTFEADIAGATGANTTVPEWGKYLEACGLIQQTTHVVEIGSITAGTGAYFIQGETLNDGTNDVGFVMHDTHDGASLLRYATNGNAVAVAAVLTGSVSGASATVQNNAGAFEGYTWHPISETVYSLTVPALDAGDVSDYTVGTPIFQTSTLAAGVIVANPFTGEIPQTGDTTLYFELGVSGTFNANGTIDTQRDGASANTIAYSALNAEVRPSLTIWLNEDGPMKKSAGMRGSCAINLETGNSGRFAFNFRGRSAPANDQTKLSGVVFTAQIPPSFISATIQLYDAGDTDFDQLSEFVAPCIDSLSIDMSNTLAPLSCASSGSGIRWVNITDREPTGSMDPLVDLEAAFPFLRHLRAGTAFGIRTGWGSEPQNAFYLTIPAAQIDDEDQGDKDGLGVRELSLKLVGGSAAGSEQFDNDFTLSYIAADPTGLGTAAQGTNVVF